MRTSPTCALTIVKGPDPALAPAIAGIFYDAFGPKLDAVHALPHDRADAVALIGKSVCLESAYVALEGEAQVAGVAFLLAHPGPTLCLDAAFFRDRYGVVGGWLRRQPWRLSHFFGPEPGVMSLEGFAVEASRRGRGVGTAMLEHILADSHRMRAEAMTLTVGDTNVRARRLYERFGFRAVRSIPVPFAKHAGFRRLIEMRLELG